MTTVAADHRSRIIVSDSKCTSGSVWSPTTKLWRHGRDLIGVAGDMRFARRWLDWYMKGKKGPVPKLEDFEAIVLRDDGVYHIPTSGYEHREEQGFFAIGSGQQAAMAVLKLGLGAEKAVEIACQIDVDSGGDLQILRLDD